MAGPILSITPRERGELPLFADVSLSKGRVHEVFGAGAMALAAMCAGIFNGEPHTVLWIRERRRREQLNPLGLADFFCPSRLLMAECERAIDCLWAMEEGLRLGAAGLVVVELKKPADLTISRRLQLAAEAGGAIGLCLVDGVPITNAMETRWHCAPAFAPKNQASGKEGKELIEKKSDGDWTHWRLFLIKNKKGTSGAWEIAWDAQAHSITMVSALSDGSDPACWRYPDQRSRDASGLSRHR